MSSILGRSVPCSNATTPSQKPKANRTKPKPVPCVVVQIQLVLPPFRRAKGAQISFPKKIFSLPQPLPPKKNLRPTPRPHPHPCLLALRSSPAGLEIFGVRRRPSMGPNALTITNKKVFLKSMTSCWPGLSDVSETSLTPLPNQQPTQPAQPAHRPAN